MDYGHSVEREFYYVLSHGMLHLLGFDHIEEEDKKIMRKREEEILCTPADSRGEREPWPPCSGDQNPRAEGR
jgi:ssRNA-specific RNase YbeY (16S rRNA maturation enzyme)